MSTERHYNEEEIAAIFKKATADHEAARQKRPRGGGLTLAELQEIGKTAGITPAFIARAAASVDQTVSAPPATTYLGLPITVARSVELPGALSDADWDQLVVDLRETFQASGEVRRDGALRQWRNGNLKALIEPTAAGHRLRLQSLDSNGRSALFTGMTFFAMNLVFLFIAVVTGKLGMNPDTMFLAMLALAGLVGIGYSAFRLPRWADVRGRQMEAVIARATERVSMSSAEEASSAGVPSAAVSSAGALPTPALNLDLDIDALEDPDAEAPSPIRTKRRRRR